MFLCLLVTAFSADEVVFSCNWTNGAASVTEGYNEDADAWAAWEDSYSEIGWGKIHIWTNASRPSYSQMYCAGFVDTYASYDRVNESFRLFKEIQVKELSASWPEQWAHWISDNIRYVRRMAENTADDYWKRMKLILAQVDGNLDGYNARALEKGHPTLLEIDWWMLQSGGDLDDLSEVFPVEELYRDPEFKLKCTGLVKLAPNYTDLWFAQDTWTDVRELHAYLKEYNLNIPEFTAHRVLISTRTGHMSSVDDFWVNDKGLLVLETTMHNFNRTLYDLYVKPESVMTWLRAYHAMFATDNGQNWTEHFIRYNSGTYNNEYLIVDTKLFEAGTKPGKNLLWMIEQYPGHYHAEDVTELRLLNDSYVQSINTPWFEDMFDIANYTGQQQAEPKKKTFWSYNDQPRNKIIVHQAPNLKDYADFQRLMRYNNYTMDPDQIIPGTNQREPAQGVLARYDLRPENGTDYGARNHFAGIDTKTLSVNTFKTSQTFDAINSPKYDEGIPEFTFADWPEINHYGLAESWHYNWTTFGARDHCVVHGGTGDKERCQNIAGCGFCMYDQRCLSGDKNAPDSFFNYECESGWSIKTVTPKWAVPLVASVSSLVLVVLIVIVGLHVYYVKHEKNANASTYEQI